MSFGYSVSDAVLLTQLAWKTVQNARQACGEHDELSREVLSLHVVLRRLEQDVERPGCPINRPNDAYKEELDVIVDGCRKVLNVLDQVLTKYNALSEQARSGRKLWQKIRFGNGKMADMAEMRGKLTFYTSAMSLFLNMVSMGTMGRVERQMNDAGGDLKDIKVAVNGITAHLMSTSNRHEGSILTAYADDDRAVWKEFRRELLEDGFSSSVIRRHKDLIKAYIEELGSRGLFDEEDPNDEAEGQYCDVDSIIEGVIVHDTQAQSGFEASLRPQPEVEMSVLSKTPLDLRTKPNAVFKSQTGSERNEGLSHDRVSRFDSQTEPKAELRWIWLSNESNERNHESPVEEIPPPKVEAESNTATTDRDRDRSNNPVGISRNRSEPYIEADGSCTEVDKSYRGSEQGPRKRRTRRSRKRDNEEPSSKSDERHFRDEFEGLGFLEAFARDSLSKAREEPSEKELLTNTAKHETNPYDEVDSENALPPDNVGQLHGTEVITPSPRLERHLRPKLSAKEKTRSDRRNDKRHRESHEGWHHNHDDLAPRCLEWALHSDHYNGIALSLLRFWMPLPNMRPPPVPNSNDELFLLRNHITQAREDLMMSKNPGFPSSRRDEMKADMESMVRVSSLFEYRDWSDKMSELKGHRFMVDMVWGTCPSFVTGCRCMLCPPR